MPGTHIITTQSHSHTDKLPKPKVHILDVDSITCPEEKVAQTSAWVYELPIRVGDHVTLSFPQNDSALELCCAIVLFRRFQECISLSVEREGATYRVFYPPLS